MGRRIAAAGVDMEVITYGGDGSQPGDRPWKGAMRSRAAEQVPPEYIADSDSDDVASDYLYLPKTRSWKRRGGTSQKFDTFGSAVGLLPAKWGAKDRKSVV